MNMGNINKNKTASLVSTNYTNRN